MMLVVETWLLVVLNRFEDGLEFVRVSKEARNELIRGLQADKERKRK